MRIKRTETGLIIAGAIILCFFAFFNNSPLIYSDTADYLGGAFGHYLPDDRPVFYGIFMRIVSLQSTLWLVVFVQGLLMSYLLFETFGIFYSGNKRNYLFMASIAILTLTTGISQNVSILLPDIFSPIGILCFINLLLNTKLNKVQRVVISIVLILCMLLHFSNMLVLALLVFLLIIYAAIKRVRKQEIAIKKRKIILCLALITSIPIIAPTCNYIFGKKFVISEGTHVFIIAHLLETGILEEYLNNECAHKDYKMCQFKDNLDTNFMWGAASAFWKLGGWEGSKDEFNKIITDIVTTPKYERMLIQRCTEYSFMQYFTFRIPVNHSWGNQQYVKDHYRMYGRDFAASLQTSNQLNYDFANQIQQILVLASLAFVMVILLIPACFKMLTTELKWFTVLIMVFSFLNAAICANFGTLNDRYQNRIIWLIPLTAFFIAEYLIGEYRRKMKQAS